MIYSFAAIAFLVALILPIQAAPASYKALTPGYTDQYKTSHPRVIFAADDDDDDDDTSLSDDDDTSLKDDDDDEEERRRAAARRDRDRLNQEESFRAAERLYRYNEELRRQMQLNAERMHSLNPPPVTRTAPPPQVRHVPQPSYRPTGRCPDGSSGAGGVCSAR